MIKKRLYEDKETEIMILGCGLSNIGARLYEEGYNYITNVDYSSVAIDYMRNKHQMYEEMDCKCKGNTLLVGNTHSDFGLF